MQFVKIILGIVICLASTYSFSGYLPFPFGPCTSDDSLGTVPLEASVKSIKNILALLNAELAPELIALKNHVSQAKDHSEVISILEQEIDPLINKAVDQLNQHWLCCAEERTTTVDLISRLHALSAATSEDLVRMQRAASTDEWRMAIDEPYKALSKEVKKITALVNDFPEWIASWYTFAKLAEVNLEEPSWNAANRYVFNMLCCTVILEKLLPEKIPSFDNDYLEDNHQENDEGQTACCPDCSTHVFEDENEHSKIKQTVTLTPIEQCLFATFATLSCSMFTIATPIATTFTKTGKRLAIIHLICGKLLAALTSH